MLRPLLPLAMAVACTPRSATGEAFLARVDAAYADVDNVSFVRKRSNDPLFGPPREQSDFLVIDRRGFWRREIDRYVWGETDAVFWGWSDKADMVYRNSNYEQPRTIDPAAVVFEPYAELNPPYGWLDDAFTATSYRHEDGQHVVHAVPARPLEAWWDDARAGGRQRDTIESVVFTFDEQLRPVSVVRTTTWRRRFTTVFERVVVDDPRVTPELFLPPSEGPPVRLDPERQSPEYRREG